ncbi:MAG: hypothetical protein FWF42_00210 [Streptococcaceae bacterium]|nr:hypothetical protein [Streptococcaceae bacterium]MCL2680901.1 hypothetical protein [Streptococcaceae bacterium]MCL2858097.1 hypothetical protein [Streptococcaceae bacterium]
MEKFKELWKKSNWFKVLVIVLAIAFSVSTSGVGIIILVLIWLIARGTDKNKKEQALLSKDEHLLSEDEKIEKARIIKLRADNDKIKSENAKKQVQNNLIKSGAICPKCHSKDVIRMGQKPISIFGVQQTRIMMVCQSCGKDYSVDRWIK